MKEDIPIYVISLASDTERRKKLKEQFPIHYSSFQFIEAIDFRGKRKKDISRDYKECKWNKRKPLSPTEVACSLSHINAMEIFLRTNSEYCIVFEDDVIGVDHDIFEVNNIIAECDSTIGLIILGGQDSMSNGAYLSGFNIGLRDIYCIPPISRSFLYRTCCYTINRSYAKKIISRQRECMRRADDWSGLLRKNEDIYFKKIFFHPESMKGSHIESSRKKFRDNINDLVFRNMKKVAIIFLRMANILSNASR